MLMHHLPGWSTNIGECGSVEPFTVQDYHDHFNVVSPNQPSFLPEFQGGAYTCVVPQPALVEG
jgi:hypothetical protein